MTEYNTLEGDKESPKVTKNVSLMNYNPVKKESSKKLRYLGLFEALAAVLITPNQVKNHTGQVGEGLLRD